jgi:hypothetical protein
MTDTLAQIATYFRSLADEELVDTEMLSRILDLVRSRWTDENILRVRAISTLAVAAGVFRYHEDDFLPPHKRFDEGDEDELPMTDARYWLDDYRDFLRGQGVDE